jgi:tripartite motif-containing protein 56
MIASKVRSRFTGSMILYDALGPFNFTSLGASGRYGPTDSQILTYYSGNDIDGYVEGDGGGIMLWTVPASTIYNFEITGAYGQFSSSRTGGLPAKVTASIYLEKGTVIKIAVGQKGTTFYGYNRAAGGGGGTFVTLEDNTPLVIAGGSGGGAKYTYGGNASLTEAGGVPSYGSLVPAVDGAGGGYMQYPGGGGGLIGRGGNSITGGESFINGPVGGDAQAAWGTYKAFGGFGGGGGGGKTWGHGGGAGGGYSGGGAGSAASYSGGVYYENGGGSCFTHADAINVTKELLPALTTDTIPTSGYVNITINVAMYQDSEPPVDPPEDP